MRCSRWDFCTGLLAVFPLEAAQPSGVGCPVPVQGLLAMRDQAVLAAELQKLVLKIFWSATYMGIPALLLQEAQFVGWMTSLLEAVKQPVPQVGPMGSQKGCTSCAADLTSDSQALHVQFAAPYTRQAAMLHHRRLSHEHNTELCASVLSTQPLLVGAERLDLVLVLTNGRRIGLG